MRQVSRRVVLKLLGGATAVAFGFRIKSKQKVAMDFENGEVDVPIADINFPSYCRCMNEDVIKVLQFSIEEHGLFHSVLLSKTKNETGYTMVNGAMRAEALRRLGHKTVRARVLYYDNAYSAGKSAMFHRLYG